MSNRTEHERLVREIASELGATVELAGSGHIRISKGSWYITLPSTPKRVLSKQQLLKRINRSLKMLAVKNVDRSNKTWTPKGVSEVTL